MRSWESRKYRMCLVWHPALEMNQVLRMCCHNAFCAIESSMLFAVRATVELVRFLGILFVIIPSLACTFIFLGLLFHIPRIFAAYMCRGLLNVCWWHMQAANSHRAKAGTCSSSKNKRKDDARFKCGEHASRTNCSSGDSMATGRRSIC